MKSLKDNLSNARKELNELSILLNMKSSMQVEGVNKELVMTLEDIAGDEVQLPNGVIPEMYTAEKSTLNVVEAINYCDNIVSDKIKCLDENLIESLELLKEL